MDSPEHIRNYMKRDVEDNSDVKSDCGGDDEEWESSDKRKHKSSRPRKPNNGEEVEGLDGNGRRRSYGDRGEGRKRSGGSSRADSDEDDYDTRKDPRSKQMKKKQEESSLEKLSSWYQDGEPENRQDGGDKSGSRGHGRSDEIERRRISSKVSEHESTRSESKNKEERSRDGEPEKSINRDSKHLERRESGREKGHGSSELGRNSKRRWDESDVGRKGEENQDDRSDLRSAKASDSRHESARERNASVRNEQSESKGRGLDSSSEKGVKSNNREERRDQAEKSKSKGWAELQEEDRGSPTNHEDKSARDKSEKQKQQRTPTGRDVSENRERSFNTDEDGNTRIRDRSARDMGHSNKSRTPERSGRRHQESEHTELDYERSSDLKRKELEKDSRKDDRSKGRDDSWSDRNRDREGSKENWKRRQPSCNDKDSKNGDILYDRGREWEFSRHGRERNENERPHGRSGNRKEGNRGEAVKTSSNFGISNENYDVIEIQTKPLDYGRADSGSNFARRTESGQQSDVKSTINEEEWAYTREDRARRTDMYGYGVSGEESRDKYMDDGNSMRDPNSWRDDIDYQGGKGRVQRGTTPARNSSGQSSSGGSQPPYGNQESGPFGRAPPQGVKGSRVGRGGKGRPAARDNQSVGLPMPIIGSPFGPLGMPPPGPMQPLTPSMSPAPGPPIPPGVFLPQFSPPVVWPGARGMDVKMLGVPPGLSPVPPGPSGPRFPPNIGTPPNPGMFFNQSGPGRGGPSSISGPGFNTSGPIGRGTQSDKSSVGWVPPRTGGPPGKAPSRGEQNDYSQNFVDTGMRPQNFIRELELTNVEDYPKLRELIQKKDEIVSKSASPPLYLKCDLQEVELSSDLFGTKFDVILVDPPWEEYVHRAPGVVDHMEYWTFEEILNLKIEVIYLPTLLLY